jgi:predicted O-methyltransferase YrrM
LWKGKLIDASIDDRETRLMRTFNEALHRDERIWISMVPIGDGLTLAVKR